LNVYCHSSEHCLQCFDAVGWAAGKPSGLKKLSGGVLVWLAAWARCRFAYGPVDATATQLVLVPANPGNPGQSPEGHKTDVSCVCVRACVCVR